ncbi:carbonic anhydrase [Kribbella sp. VKM Ac-2527]|uniref:Carbonic anhydrase n=1 Tax=Kribbella caucasensis TaxID=2512215 RepID=A0A4R6K507_9ACTN|nr:carbonic anhydrase [Kribbella sp. VKM Ac-2527]TDO44329.1 carbonic anhydrase [Kribbella sp. VKM Ac-2527]
MQQTTVRQASGRRPTTRRRFLTTTLSSTLGAGLGAAALTACAADDSAAGTPVAHSTPGSARPAAAPTIQPPVANGKEALQRLVEGNQRFVANRSEEVDEGEERRVAVSKGQHPFATVLGCVDSRVPIELVFDQGLGDLVVVRSAGEVLDHSVTASLEFGVAELGTPLLMVLGHQRCGALTATIKALDAQRTEAEAGEIGYLVDALAPAVRQVKGKSGDRLDNAVHANVDLVLAQLRKSTVLGPLEKSGKVRLVGAYYELDTGKVTLNPS